MFLFLRKSGTSVATSGFSAKERYNIPSSGSHTIIRLIPPNILPKCICGGTNIYRDFDLELEEPATNPNCSKSHDEPPALVWFQAHQTMKGFKDVKINGISASNVWLHSR